MWSPLVLFKNAMWKKSFRVACVKKNEDDLDVISLFLAYATALIIMKLQTSKAHLLTLFEANLKAFLVGIIVETLWLVGCSITINNPSNVLA